MILFLSLLFLSLVASSLIFFCTYDRSFTVLLCLLVFLSLLPRTFSVISEHASLIFSKFHWDLDLLLSFPILLVFSLDILFDFLDFSGCLYLCLLFFLLIFILNHSICSSAFTSLSSVFKLIPPSEHTFLRKGKSHLFIKM